MPGSLEQAALSQITHAGSPRPDHLPQVAHTWITVAGSPPLQVACAPSLYRANAQRKTSRGSWCQAIPHSAGKFTKCSEHRVCLFACILLQVWRLCDVCGSLVVGLGLGEQFGP